jgi:hypothetical protein
MNSISVELQRFSMSRPAESLHLEPEARVRCGWTARPEEREAGKEAVVFFWLGASVSLIHLEGDKGEVGRKRAWVKMGGGKLEHAPWWGIPMASLHEATHKSRILHFEPLRLMQHTKGRCLPVGVAGKTV